MNLKEDIHAQNVQLKISNKDLTVKLNNTNLELSLLRQLETKYRHSVIAYRIVLVASIFFNLFAYYLLTR